MSPVFSEIAAQAEFGYRNYVEPYLHTPKEWALQRSYTVALLLLGLVIVYNVLNSIYLVYFHPLAKYPGPALAKVSELWKVNIAIRAKWLSTLQELHDKHGSVVRIGPNEVSLNMPSEIRKVYGVGGYLKGPFYHSGDFGSGLFKQTILSARDPAVHNNIRRFQAAPYNFAFLQSLEGFCDNTTEWADAILAKHAERGTSFDMADLTGWYAFDSAALLGFGKDHGFLKRGADTKYLIRNVVKLNHYSLGVAGSIPSIGWIYCTRWFQFFNGLAEMATFQKGVSSQLFRESAELALDRIRRHEGEKNIEQDTRDMLSRLIGENNPTTGKPLTVPELIGAAQTVVAAGGDTTRISLTATIYYVYSHPEVLRKIREELANALEKGTAEWPLPYKQAAKLDYLQACMKEAMRMYPAVGMPLQRCVPKGGATLEGEFFPEGTNIGMVAQVVHFNPEAYGPDAKEFKPERWLVGEEERRVLERSFLSFGQGPRICLGRNISLMEMSKFLPFLFWHYDIQIVNPSQPWKLHESWFVGQNDFMVKATKRNL